MDNQSSEIMFTSVDDSNLDRVQVINQTAADVSQAANLPAIHFDLRNNKSNLIDQPIGPLPQQMIVTTPSKTSSDKNLATPATTTTDSDTKLQTRCQEATSIGEIKVKDIPDIILAEDGSNQEQMLFSKIRGRWYTNEEVASILTSFSSHPEWLTNELKVRPKSGAVLLYSREKVRYRQDGYCWKKRKNGRTTREDHMKLKVQGIECIYGCYVHSAILPTFHRRCYWLLENPDIVLVHYLNQPPDDKNKMKLTFGSNVLEADTRRRWTNQEIIEEIGAVFGDVSEIQHSISINFPTSSDSVSNDVSVVEADLSDCGQGDQVQVSQSESAYGSQVPAESGEMESSDLNSFVDHQMDTASSDKHLQEAVSGVNLGVIEKVQAKEGGDEVVKDRQNIEKETKITDDGNLDHDADGENEMLVINSDSNFDITPSSNHFVEAINETNLDDKCARPDQSNDDGMAFDVPISSKDLKQHSMRIDGGDSEETNIGVRTGKSLCEYGSTKSNLALSESQDVDRESLLNSSGDFYAPTISNNENGRHMEQSLCSPVTQIYNKIVDDIETHVLPLEPDQFTPDHHHLHHHHRHRHDLSPAGISIQTMDTSESATMADENHHRYRQTQSNEYSDQSSLRQRKQRQLQHSLVDLTSDHQYDDDQRQEALSDKQAACDLFSSCGINGLDQIDHSQSDNTRGCSVDSGGDILLSEFNLTDVDNLTNQVAGGDALENVDDMSDLMMGIQSVNEHDDRDSQSNQLLISDTDPLDIFNYKPSNCHEQKSRLDVKSTTSDTGTMNRLSPLIPCVPRCNSTDNATRSSMHRFDHFQHHVSNQFLTQEHPLNAFSEYKSHDVNRSHRSATSAELSTSTSCSASPSSSSLIIASGAINFRNDAFGACDTDSGDQSSRSAYLEGSSNSNSFMKLPLQQRQNSEQKEPSNSVLNSLLPKALSLDGSDLSSNHHRLHSHHLHPHSQHHHAHHHNNHRSSPLKGSFGIGHSRADYNMRLSYGAHNHNQAHHHQNQMLLVPQCGNNSQHAPMSSHSLNIQRQHHHFHRPSVPSISPTTGNYPFESSTSSLASKVLVNGNQYRSGSLGVSTISQHASNQSHQQAQQQNSIEHRGLQQSIATHIDALPILDYVPNWSTSAGGTKVLLIGNWTTLLNDSVFEQQSNKIEEDFNATNSSSQLESGFNVLFDDLSVPATLIQDNVLRCYSPYHEPGFIALKVSFRDLIVSEQVLFEIRAAQVTTAETSSMEISATGTTANGQSSDSFVYSPLTTAKSLDSGSQLQKDQLC